MRVPIVNHFPLGVGTAGPDVNAAGTWVADGGQCAGA
jgi:hypothetical protein